MASHPKRLHLPWLRAQLTQVICRDGAGHFRGKPKSQMKGQLTRQRLT